MFALCCQLNQHIMRFAPLNVFWSKQLLLERHQPLDKCHSYSLKIPKAGEEKVKQASNVFGFKMEKSELAFIWILWFCSIIGFIFMLPNNFPGYESHSVFAYKKANMVMCWTSWKPRFNINFNEDGKKVIFEFYKQYSWLNCDILSEGDALW